jgi:membrane protein DedA with SNARE-associated domain
MEQRTAHTIDGGFRPFLFILREAVRKPLPLISLSSRGRNRSGCHNDGCRNRARPRAFFAARTHGIDIWSLVAAGIIAAILGEIVGFWIGRRFGHQLLMRYGTRLGFTEGRITICQWLFVRYGGRFVFIARFLPFLRNISAVLAGTNSMAQHSFYFASASAAVAWIICYGFAAYSFGEAFGDFVSPAAVFLGLAATLIILAAPVLILRYETRLLKRVLINRRR